MLKERLKKALKKAGLNQGLADLINITSEDQIEGVITQLKQTQNNDEPTIDFGEILKSEAFESYVQENGFDKVLELSKTLQSEHDRKVTKGISKGLETVLKKTGGKSTEEENKSDSGKNDDTPEWAKSLEQRIYNIESGNKKTEFKDKVTKALSSSTLPGNLKTKWASRIIEGGTSIEEQVKSLETEHQETYQEFIGERVGRGLPDGSSHDGKVTDEELEEIFNG